MYRLSYHQEIDHTLISYHIISYRIVSNHIKSYQSATARILLPSDSQTRSDPTEDEDNSLIPIQKQVLIVIHLHLLPLALHVISIIFGTSSESCTEWTHLGIDNQISKPHIHRMPSPLPQRLGRANCQHNPPGRLHRLRPRACRPGMCDLIFRLDDHGVFLWTEVLRPSLIVSSSPWVWRMMVRVRVRVRCGESGNSKDRYCVPSELRPLFPCCQSTQ